MSRYALLGELAGFLWLCADAAWALGSSVLTGPLFGAAIATGLLFIWKTWRAIKGER